MILMCRALLYIPNFVVIFAKLGIFSGIWTVEACTGEHWTVKFLLVLLPQPRNEKKKYTEKFMHPAIINMAQQQQKCVTNAKYVFKKLIFLLAPAKKAANPFCCGVWQLGIFFLLSSRYNENISHSIE